MKRLNLIVTGGIAASKSKELYHLLAKKYDVKLILSTNAGKFVDFESYETHDKIFTESFYDPHHYGKHIKMSHESDLNIVYPASFNFIAKIANGIADDLPSLVFAASKSKTILFPSMNSNMYLSPILEKNKKTLLTHTNIRWIEPTYGKLASGHEGIGRSLEPIEAIKIIDEELTDYLNINNKKFMLNFGRTRSYIDKIRYITNTSSGKMGLALRNALLNYSQSVISVFGDTDFNLQQNEKNIYCNTNEEMLEVMKKNFFDSDVVICCAALNDFEVLEYVDKKIEKRNLKNNSLKLDLKYSIDVLKELGGIKRNQFLVGFSLSNEFDFQKAKEKIVEKNLDMLVVNLLDSVGKDKTSLKIMFNDNTNIIHLDNLPKHSVAFEIIKAINEKLAVHN